MANEDIKKIAETKKVYLWEIASVLGMHDSNFSRKLRFELADEEKEKIKNIINDLSQNKEG